MQAQPGAKVVVVNNLVGNLYTEASPVSALESRNRKNAIRRIREDWIEGILDKSLHDVVRVELGLQVSPEAVQSQLDAIVQAPEMPPSRIPHGTGIGEVFENLGRAMLILGDPGTGKTTLLLELLKALLEKADADEAAPIPVVLNLSTWAKKRLPLSSWMVAELKDRHGIPARLGKQWVERDQILPLLDGLDEVAEAARVDCIQAINAFHGDRGLLPIAVCSRIADYEALRSKLVLRSAVKVQPLDEQQVTEYLSATPHLASLRTAASEDPSLAEILRTPLMLWIAVLAYKDAAVDSFEVSRGDDLHKRLFAHYVDAMFRRRAIETRYQREETLRWLTWMARVLQRQNLTIFALEDLRPAWLPTRSQRVLARTMLFVGTMLGFSAVCFIVAWAGYLVSGGVTFIFNRAGIMRLPLTNWRAQLAYGLYIGGFASMLLAPVGGAIAAFTNLRPADRIQLGLAGIRKRLWQGAGVAVVTELLLWTVKRFIDTDADIGPLLVASPWPVAVAAGVLRMFLAETADARSRTNEGTRRSIRVAALLTSLTIVIALFAALRDGLHFWLAFSMIVAGLSGGLFAIRHMVLRAVLWLIRDAPFRYPRFLEYATARLFLRKAGGGFIFMHRMLLDYFASLPITRSRS